MGFKAGDAVVIVDHGSRRAESNAMLRMSSYNLSLFHSLFCVAACCFVCELFGFHELKLFI